MLGSVADELRRATIPVVDDLSKLAVPPEIIHGHHHLETLMAALAFPAVPIVHFCHGWVPWEEMPLIHPSIRRYVAVDEVCRDRLVLEEGIEPSRVELLLNFVDLARFRPRSPLPARPAKALVLSNQATADGYVRAIAAACAGSGVEVEIVGRGCGHETDRPEEILPSYDLVFAKGRTALEAMAVGCAVVVTDAAGAGPLVTPDNFDRLRARNFGIRELRQPHTIAWYADQIARYDAGEAAAVSARVRASADLERAVDRLVTLYETAVASPPGSGSSSMAAAQHLRRIARPLKDALDLKAHAADVSSRLEDSAARLNDTTARLAETTAQLDDCRRQVAAERDRVQVYSKSATLRLRDRIVRLPVVGSSLGALARGLARLLVPADSK